MRRGLLLVMLLSGCSGDDAPAAGPSDAGADGPLDAGADGPLDAGADAPAFAVGSKRLLSTANPLHKDEDPSVLAASDGSMLVAYFSEREGNADIYVAKTTDGETFSEARVTSDPAADFYTHLHRGDDGVVHLVWFRWTAFQVGSIWHASSADGVSWGPETRVTNTPDVDDWVPSITSTATGDLLVHFASEKRNPAALSELYLARRPAGAAAWEPAVAVSDVNDPSEHDSLPFALRSGSTIHMVWVRSDASAPLAWENASSDVFHSTSTDGSVWTAPVRVTSDQPDDVVDVFPSLYEDHAGELSLLWISTRTPGGGAWILPLAELSTYPAAASPSSVFEGYSPRAAATPTSGVFLGAWVEADPVDPELKDVFVRFFSP